jgi:hypothetical protein
MTKRSILLALGTALALVVLTAGLAFANNRWDGHHSAQYATGQQATNAWTQAGAQQPSSPVRSANSRTGHDWCDQTTGRGATTTHSPRGDSRCADPTSHRFGSLQGAQPTPATSATGTRPSSGQQDRHSEWMTQHRSHDDHGWDSRR